MRHPFRLAGLGAFLNALLTLPVFYMSLRLEEGSEDPTSLAIQISLQWLSIFVSSLVTYALIQYFRTCHATSRFDDILGSMIFFSVIVGGIYTAARIAPRLTEQLNILLLATAILQGILLVRFGWMLVSSSVMFGRYISGYGWLSLVTGVCLLSIVLLPVALVTGAISDLLLGTIFMNTDGRRATFR
ncbi:MAG: hypothetical protein Fur0034_13950 [Desulfuromonadia bacterium]